MSPTCTGSRKAISSIAAVTAGPPLWRWATAPAVLSTSRMITPPWTLPSRFTCVWPMSTARPVRAIPGASRERSASAGSSAVTSETVASRPRLHLGEPVADRRNPTGGPGSDRDGQGNQSDETASYEWLYGDRKSQSDPSATESTQVIPTSSRSGGGDAPPRHIAPTPGGPPPSARDTSHRPRFRARWLLYLLLAWVVFLIAVPIY